MGRSRGTPRCKLEGRGSERFPAEESPRRRAPRSWGVDVERGMRNPGAVPGAQGES